MFVRGRLREAGVEHGEQPQFARVSVPRAAHQRKLGKFLPEKGTNPFSTQISVHMASHDDKGEKKPADTPQRDRGHGSGGDVHKKSDREWSRDEPPKKPDPTNRKVPPGHKP
jgi:hypothetical protein